MNNNTQNNDKSNNINKTTSLIDSSNNDKSKDKYNNDTIKMVAATFDSPAASSEPATSRSLRHSCTHEHAGEIEAHKKGKQCQQSINKPAHQAT